MLFNINESALADSQKVETIVLQFRIAATSGCALFPWNGNTDSPRVLAEGGSGSAMAILTQAAIDTLLSSTNEVLSTTAFGTTAMADNNTVAFVLDCAGQVAHVSAIRAYVNIAGTCGTKNGVGTKTAFTNAGFTGVQAYVTANGNIAGRMTYTNVSAAASEGFVCFELDVKFK